MKMIVTLRRSYPCSTTAEPFAPAALYALRIDTDGDAMADLTYQVRFFVVPGRRADRYAAPPGSY